MDKFTIALWLIAAVALILSMKKSKEKTVKSVKKAKGMLFNMMSKIVAILLLIGLILTFIPPEIIQENMGSSNTAISTIISALVGSITLIPGFVAFQLVGAFIDAGVPVVPAAAFLTTLTMVGIVTYPLEREEFGSKFALTRNVVCFGFAIVIAFLMGVFI